MEESKASSEYLHFGQQISISLEEDSYIYSKGFVDNNIYLQQLDNIGTYDFAGAVFRVLPQCMYSIQNDLLISSEALHHSQFHDKFLRHEESLEGEIKTNIQTYNNFKGEPVRFGTIIQLQHVMSYKFLTLIPQENAEIEKENLKIKLTEFASECSYLRIETAYKFQNEGDGLVRINDKVVFELMLPELIKTAYLNASDYFTSVKSELLPSDTLRREINVSLDHKVKWKVKSFSKFISERENILLSGDYIWITHSEEESCLVANIRNEADKIFFNTNMNDTNGLWKIENDNEREGGYVISDRLYRLRHTGSGLFLSAFEKEEEVKKAKSSSRYKNEVTYNVCLSDKKDVNNLWKFQPLHNSKKARRIERDDLCVLINNETGYSLRGAEDVNLEQDSKIIPVLKAGISEDGYFKVFKCEDSLIWGTLFLLDCMPILKEFPEFIQKHSKVSIKHENLSMIREFKKTTDLIIKCLDNLVLFCKNKLKSMITVDKQFGHVETLRQKILREQLFIDALTDILDTIFQGNFSLSKVLGLGKIDSIDSDIKVKKNKDLSLELHKSQLQTVISIAKKIYIVLSAVCNGNKDNQNYAFKFFKIFQKHAAYGLGATNAMITMLSHNEHLLLQLHKPQGLNSDRSQDSIIGHYAWLLRKFYRERKPQLVDFLRFICTYNGEGLSVNQEKIHEMLFCNPETHSKAVITTSTLSDKMVLYVFLQHPSGIGEENIALESCFSNGVIEPKFYNEIEYFTRMLELFSDMCTGRNYICKASIKDWFPIQIIVNNIWNDQLSPHIRAAFMKLMLNMHIDSQPREESKKPELIRVLGLVLKEDQKLVHRQRHAISNPNTSIETVKRLSKRFTHTPTGSPKSQNSEDFIVKFEKDELVIYRLKEDIINFLKEECFEPKFNILTHQVLKMGRQLAKFEVLGSACSSTKQGYCILDQQHELFSYEEMDIIRLLKALKPLLLNNIAISPVKVQKPRPKSSKKVQESFESLLTKILNEANSLEDPVVKYSENLRNFLKSYVSSDEIIENNENERSYENKCKIEICQTLHYALDWRQDFLLNNVVTWFNTEYMNRALQGEREIKSLFPPIIKTQKIEVKNDFLGMDIGINLNLSSLKLKFEFNKEPDPEFKVFVEPEIKDISYIDDKIVTQLLRLFCVSSDYKMQSLLIHLILRLFSQRTELVKNIKKLHVMTLLQDTEIFTWTKSNLYTFKQLSEQSELWLKYWTQTPFLMEKNIEKLETVQDILDMFELVMYNDTVIQYGTPVPGVKKSIDKERQIMCYHLSLHSYIITLLRDGMYSLSEIYDDPKNSKELEGRSRMIKLFTSCYSVLVAIVKKNPKIQKKFYNYLNTFTAFLRIPIGQVELICEIFKNNQSLCNSIKDDFVTQFLELVITEGRQARFLQIFEVIQNPSGSPLPDIQRLVLMHLLDPTNSTHICYMNNDNTSFSFEPSKTPPLFSPNYKDEPFLYHSVLIKVLNKCGQGTSGVYLTEAKCQKIINLNVLFNLLNNEDPRYEILHIPLLWFFYNIYLDSEQKVEDLENSKDFLAYISKSTRYLNAIKSEEDVNIEFYEIWISILQGYSKKYIQEVQSFKINDDIDSICGYLETLSNKWENFKVLSFSQNFFDNLQELGMKYNYIFERPIVIDDINYTAPPCFDISRTKERWTEFCDMVLYSDSLKGYLSQENSELYTLIFDIGSIEEGIDSTMIFKKMINFIKMSSTYKPPAYVLINIFKFLSSVISNPKTGKEESKDEAIKKLQDEFHEYGAAKVVLGLMCDKEIEDQTLTSLLYFAIKLLEGGNEKIQQDFYQYFITVTSSNAFFQKVYELVNEFIEKLLYTEDHKKIPIYNTSDIKISNVMRLLQELCENHNQLLQNYLRVQTNSRNNHDMINLTILLLEELMKRKSFYHFLIISQCFDTLTEFIQGPCRDNQKAIIDSKFLEIANALLSLDEKSDSLSKYENLVGDAKMAGRAENCLKGWMIAHLKYKCMITIQSLLEGQLDNYVITRLIRALNIEIFKENLISLYLIYLEQYSKGYYDYQLFCHYDGNDEYIFGQVNEQDKTPEKYQFIIETGFLIYHLMCCYKDNDDPENKAIIENELPELSIKEEASNFLATQLIGDLGKLGLNLFKSGFSAVTSLVRTKKVKSISMSEEDRKNALKEAYSFFQLHSGNVEVIFDEGKIFKVYYWIPPECHHLTPDSKESFHENVDRSSDKAKVQYIVQKADEMLEEMQHEFRLSKFYNKYKFISFFTSNVTVWKELAFTMTLLLNFLIIGSYYKDDNMDRNNPSLFYGGSGGLSASSTQVFMRIIGLIQCICAILIVTFFIMKTAPVLIKRGWKKHHNVESGVGCIKVMYIKLRGMLLTLYFTLSNIDVLYHLLYMIFSILGIAYTPLFFSLHLLDILYRYPTLQDVIKSVVLPRKSLMLTFMLILVLIYLFSIWAYLAFYDYYDTNCDNMIMCIKTTFDQGIKNGGGIGQYLDQNLISNASLVVQNNYDIVTRFMFDDLFNIIIMIIMLNIIQGIIIDTFALLREESDKNTLDRETKCFICGREKEYIERCTNRPFRYHCVYEHNEWNYIYFLAYLKKKASTEHTGIESKISELVEKKEISWIPQQQGLTLKDDDQTEELQLYEKMDNITGTYETLQKEMKELKKYFSDYLESKQLAAEL